MTVQKQKKAQRNGVGAWIFWEEMTPKDFTAWDSKCSFLQRKCPSYLKAWLGVGKAVSCWAGLAEFHTAYAATKEDVTEPAPHPVYGWNLNLLFWNSLRHISGMVGWNCWCWLFLQSGFDKGRAVLRRQLPWKCLAKEDSAMVLGREACYKVWASLNGSLEINLVFWVPWCFQRGFVNWGHTTLQCCTWPVLTSF